MGRCAWGIQGGVEGDMDKAKRHALEHQGAVNWDANETVHFSFSVCVWNRIRDNPIVAYHRY